MERGRFVIVISIVLLATSPKTDAQFVFTNFSNTTGWSDGTAWMLGLLQSALSFIGWDAVAHMTEEMPRPSKDAPQAMVAAVLVGGTTLSHLHPKLNVPVRAIVVQAVFNLLFGLLYLGPEVAFNAYIASCTLFLNLSYAAPVLILLIRGRQMVLSQPPEFSLGRVKGYIANYTAVIFVAVTSVFFCFPPAIPINVSTMSKSIWPTSKVGS
ncbi:hypothetical protein BFJ68_g12683 [Fusarium oxysporum]|uniref:Uncharacterized protein n=1 Tax=Fusarium oxysporum TaxID=5507 RepID=A0A420Q7D0_FUSOX|nr:hypothetical protein BFJ68_g12683 [Fusarium oxysporum]